MEMMETLSDGGNPVHGPALINEIDRYGIQISTSTRAIDISETGVVGEYVGGAYTLPPCPTVQAAVLQSNSFGRAVRADAEVGSAKLFAADTVVYQIGDCWIARTVQQATRMAFAIARDI
jgi:hypothetical protein